MALLGAAGIDRSRNVQTVNLLLEGIRQADAVGIVEVAPDGDDAEVRTLWADHRLTSGADVRPSRRLVREARRR